MNNNISTTNGNLPPSVEGGGRKRGFRRLGVVLSLLLLPLLLRCCAVTSYLIPSSGMENSLYEGERILVNKWSYGLRLPFMQIWGYHRWQERRVEREDIVVFNNPANATQPHIDKRKVFINRCIGLPGDTLMVDSLFSVVSARRNAPDQKFLYAYPGDKEQELLALLDRLFITPERVLGKDSVRNIRSFSRYEYYLLQQALNDEKWIVPMGEPDTLQLLRPLVVPRKGMTVQVTPWNRTLLLNTLLLHEARKAELKNDTLYVDGKPITEYQFTKDYYWMVSNSPVSISDSRLFGFVPHDHLIGKASLIWFSKKRDSGWFDGFRWERMGERVK